MKINLITILGLLGLVFQFPIFMLYGTYVSTFDIASIWALVFMLLSSRLSHSKILVVLITIVVSGLFSLLMNVDHLKSIPQSILYSIRMLEYGVWFYIGINASKKLINLLIILIFVKSLTSFYFGTYVIPFDYLFFRYDHDIVASLLIVSLFYLKQSYHLPMMISLLISSMMSLRSAYFGIIYIIYTFLKSYKGTTIKTTLLCVMVLGLIVSLIINESLVNRFLSLFNYENIDAISKAYQQSLAFTTYDGFLYDSRNLFTTDGDLSFQLRLRKWMFYIGQLSVSPVSLLYGFGPSAFGGAADSSIVRVLLEGGLIMFFLYLALIKRLVQYSPSGKEYIYLTIALSLMLDISFSSAIMPLIFFIIGSHVNDRD